MPVELDHLSDVKNEKNNMTLYRAGFARLRWVVLMLLSASAVAIANVLGLSDQFLSSIESNYGPPARERLENWQTLVDSSRDLDEAKKLEAVNDFFNTKLIFVNDIDHWGVKDYWATPVESLVTNAGDCEDYSIAKYFTLLELDVPEEKLRMTYVKAIRINQAHMVVAYYPEPNAVPLVLDNLSDFIVPASKRRDLVPVYSFNGTGLYIAQQRGKGKRVGDSGKVKKWGELASRMQSGEIKQTSRTDLLKKQVKVPTTG